MAKKKLTGMPWLREAMEEMGYNSLQECADAMGINRGNLWRYFTLETRPSVAMLPVFCDVLFRSPQEVLRALEILAPNETI